MLKKIEIVNNLSFYKKTTVPADGYCFYHSLSVGLKKMNIINQGLDIDYKYLKQICIDYFQKNKNNHLFQNQIKNELRNKYTTSEDSNKNVIKNSLSHRGIDNASSGEKIIEYIDNYIAQGINNDEWGRPDIEGQIICDFFKEKKINIHLVVPNKINDKLAYSHVLYAPEKSITTLITSEDFENNYNILISTNTICIFHNGNKHFEYACFSPTILQPNESYVSGGDIIDNNSEDNEFFDTVNDIHPKNVNIDDELNILASPNYKNLKNTKSWQTPNINTIVMTKNIDNNWNIKKQLVIGKTIKESLFLENNDTEVLDNLIKKYKNDIIIIFEKNTKKFKEAFVIDNEGNKKNIFIDKIETVKSLEKIFHKVSKFLNPILNDFDAKSINDLVKTKTYSESNNNKSKNNQWIGNYF